ncbi:sensor histidine kinase [Rugosimonospora africana]|uniref:histidine kinase n=1 Tax=Rugosimonospora africana TaxID=556532 RepID=A0A8J3R2T4_9ACTN|nr:ATP-binding protein [Rugosimonospora africana]GIH20507.1 sensor histidine kinase [Rugosimonospora africana]
MSRGQLRVYLGAAPGVGKTYKMLEEGHRRRERGTDVVVGYVECHGRRHTEAMLGDLEVVPRRTIAYRGSAFTEMDIDAVLARKAEVVLVDELPHTNVPGARNAKRWQDIQELLDAGMTVITTVNIQHLESINDVVQEITGVPQRETVPDEIVRRAEQIELVDMAPDALRRRMAHGNIYAPEKIDAALGNYFRAGNLTALRELALLWVADKVDEQLDRYRAEHHISATWETRERVVVALTGGPEGDTLIRRAARIADRTKGAGLVAVHVTPSDGLTGSGDPANLARQRTLVEDLGGTYHQVIGSDIPTALLDFARGVNATQLVLGASRRGRLAQIFSPGVGVTTTAGSGTIDVHLVSHEEVKRGRGRVAPANALSWGRRGTGFALAALGLPALTALLTQVRADVSLPSDILLYLAWVVVVALVGGLFPALCAAVGGFLLLNYYFVPPIHLWTIDEWENILALFVFLAVAVAVSATVDAAARRTREAASARAEALTLSTLAGSVLRGSRPLPAVLDQLREAFGLTGVSLLERRPDAPPGPQERHDPAVWRLTASVGDKPCLTPTDGEVDIPIDPDLTLALRGGPLAAADRRVVEAFAAQAAVALRQERLAEQAATASTLAEADKLRTALLSAVSHDLRTPLASAKAAITSLRSHDVVFDEHDRDELLATADESLDRLVRLVENLLDMSRLQAGVLGMSPQPMSAGEAVAKAVDQLGTPGRDVRIQVPDELAEINVDPALLERILANVLSNALRHSPPGRPPMVTASEHAGYVEVRVIDHGPGIPVADRERVFLPFQRLGDRDNDTGVGLGLALSRGLAEAMNGTLEPDTTPGGGLTMTLRLPGTRPLDPSPVPAQPTDANTHSGGEATRT